MDHNMANDELYTSKYVTESQAPERIMVLGVGGGGSNAVNYMYRENMIKGVSFVVANTDRQALNSSPVPHKLLLGPTSTRGLGAGAVPEVGREAAEESATEIDALFTDDTDMVFITAGMGGGTGTGAAPVVARIARQRGILTIGIVTIPFLFEGMKKINMALTGAQEMRQYVDSLMIINNERLTEIYPDLDFESAFAKADDTLSIAAQSISEIVTAEGRINLDQRDVNTTLRNGGTSMISIGYGEGENRVTKAIEDALYNPLLKNTDIFTSKRLLFNISFSPNAEQPFKIDEARQLNAFVTKMQSHVDVIWGQSKDESLGNKVKITLLASGFDVTVKDKSPEDEDVIVIPNNNKIKEKEPEIDKHRLSEYYGSDKIDNIIREKESQNYVIFNDNTLDDDDMIEEFDKIPTIMRNHKSMSASTDRTAININQSKPQSAPVVDHGIQDEFDNPKIDFSEDDDNIFTLPG